ncbi:MAG: GNAT family N-acetyltransferase [Spirochaetales bacterium]|nr:GNAT family N-acetyltransferase [Spirochaetales bacterium]
MVIRRINSADIPYLADLLAGYRQEQGRDFAAQDRDASIEQFRALADSDSLVWVAAGTGKSEASPDVPVGYLNAHRGHFPLLGGTELYISDLLVHKEFRGQGIGSRLISVAEDYARSIGCVRIMLHNRKKDQSYARGYYTGLGYRERPEVANMVKELGKPESRPVSALPPGPAPSSTPVSGVDRFLGKAQTYRKARPGYPAQVFARIAPEPGTTIVELGAGTGIFSIGLLERGVRVLAVEPNPDMLNVLEEELLAYTGARIIPKAAHETGLEDHCADAVVCAQSFHWFANEASMNEMRRLLKPGAPLWLVWNQRTDGGNGLAKALDILYQDVSPLYRPTDLQYYLDSVGISPESVEEYHWDTSQNLDKEGLVARLESNSHWPTDPDLRVVAKKKVGKLFHEYAQEGRVTLHYDTVVYKVTLK